MNDESPDILRARLNAETGRLDWHGLAPHFARGAVIRVGKGMDLVDVAVTFAKDRRDRVEAWLEEGCVEPASEDDARRWSERDVMFWAVVVAPWVLVQEIDIPASET